ncbi:MAG: hypothetical protein MZV49_04410 [Rhodopseudomonas palustris]|nr:hypothetical protein [Rhodopseudomonas palustris]
MPGSTRASASSVLHRPTLGVLSPSPSYRHSVASFPSFAVAPSHRPRRVAAHRRATRIAVLSSSQPEAADS